MPFVFIVLFIRSEVLIQFIIDTYFYFSIIRVVYFVVPAQHE